MTSTYGYLLFWDMPNLLKITTAHDITDILYRDAVWDIAEIDITLSLGIVVLARIGHEPAVGLIWRHAIGRDESLLWPGRVECALTDTNHATLSSHHTGLCHRDCLPHGFNHIGLLSAWHKCTSILVNQP